jgi:hypothetical protein
MAIATPRLGPNGIPLAIKPNSFVDQSPSSRLEVRCRLAASLSSFFCI